ncbi:FAD-dependent oxidoreductase [Amycolatopsis sp. NPDC098790]|uniref:FAD-dependent oxidoreductase n=1 Tax=Amycolatopsis sp. NPDC098790 TaxID=3363939 RepID=UPI003819F561
MRVAIVGTGPAALYAAAELSELRGVEVTLVERLPTPFGLLRAGVAPDHERTREMADRFAWVLRRPNVTCLFDAELGRDVTVAELASHHHAVICATGASGDRRLGVPGEDLPGSVTAREFVGWYNGHPDFAERQFDFSGSRAVVLGNGNVAFDVARILTRPAADFERTAMAGHAVAALRGSGIEQVQLVARRGPASAACSTAELLELSRLPGVDLMAVAGETVIPDEVLRAAPAPVARRLDIVRAAASRIPIEPRRVVLRFGLTPVALRGDDEVSEVEFAHRDGTTETIATSLVVRAIGFRGEAVPGLPFDERVAVVPNERGRVIDPGTGVPLPGLYCTGWIKRGPSGVIGTNRADAAETVAALLEDVANGLLPEPSHGGHRLIELVRSRRMERTGRL